jgi:transposase
VAKTSKRSLAALRAAATLSGWRGAFLVADDAELTTKPMAGGELEGQRLKARLGAALIERDLLHEKIAIPEAGLWPGAGRPRAASRPR